MTDANVPPADHAALDVDSLPGRLAQVEPVTERLGPDSAAWRVREVGDGKLNLVSIVESEQANRPRGGSSA